MRFLATALGSAIAVLSMVLALLLCWSGTLWDLIVLPLWRLANRLHAWGDVPPEKTEERE